MEDRVKYTPTTTSITTARFPAPFIKLLTTLLLLLSSWGCQEQEETVTFSLNESDILQFIVDRQFNGEVDPATEIARVNNDIIYVSDLAICLEAHPGYTIERCLEVLIDIPLLLQQETDADRNAMEVSDGRTFALASAILREEIERPTTDGHISEQALQDFMTDPHSRIYFESPPLRQASHMLVKTGEGMSPVQAREIATRIHQEVDWQNVSTLSDLREVGSRYQDEIEQAGFSLVVESLPASPAFTDPPEWSGFIRLDPDFLEGLFSIAEVGQVSQPTQSSFGMHFILLEEEIPAIVLSPEDAREIALLELTHRERTIRSLQLIEELGEKHDVLRIEPNFDYLRGSAEEIFQFQRTQMQQEIQSQ